MSGGRFQLGQLEEMIRESIPLAEAMSFGIVGFDDEGLRLVAPLEDNGNPHGTIFGGSAAALAILAGWSLVQLRLQEEGLDPALVIQRSSMDFTSPAHGDLVAVAVEPDEEAWERFLRTYRRRGRARIAITVLLRAGGGQVANATGWYVALREDEAA